LNKENAKYSIDSMFKFLHNITWFFKGIKVFALVGKAGTGKSFRAKLVAQKYGIELIIDDGLLIYGQKILAGKSAKKEKNFLGAVKTALFDDPVHRKSVVTHIRKQNFKRVLIIGTSERMVRKISKRLELPPPSKILLIENLASKEEIKTAIHSRYVEGKHVIPVPVIEIHRTYPRFVYDSVKVFLKKRFSLKKNNKFFEKSIVRPEFSDRGSISLSEPALTQMVIHCIDEFDDTISVQKINMSNTPEGYKLKIIIHIPYGIQLAGTIHNLQDYIIDNIERYSGVLLSRVSIKVDQLS